MKRRQAYKFQLIPNGEQTRLMRKFSGCCRFVYNYVLQLQKENHEAGKPFISYVSMAAKLPVLKRSQTTKWLKTTPSQSLQHALKDLDRAFKNFFDKRAAFPRFKKKGKGDSFRYPDPKQFKIDSTNSRISLPKLGWVRYHNSRKILGTPKNITITQSAGRWFLSIQTEREVEKPIPVAATAIGIDVGIARFATLSDGTFFEPLNSFKKHETQLRRCQREMSRKTKFSKNWRKSKAKVQKIHSQIANSRRDYLHKTSHTISKNHAMVCVEDLQVRNMSKSASGNTEKPGRKVSAKRGLNKAILDQGWYEFRRQLEYKVSWNGGWFVAVPPKNTSRTCPYCNHISGENRITQAKFLCVECGFTENADVVGAINVLRAGHARLACGEKVQLGLSVKQEPTEETTQSSV